MKRILYFLILFFSVLHNSHPTHSFLKTQNWEKKKHAFDMSFYVSIVEDFSGIDVDDVLQLRKKKTTFWNDLVFSLGDLVGQLHFE